MFKVYKKSVTISLTNVKMLTRYQKNKEMLRKEVHERYQNLSEEEKDKILQYCHKHHKKLPENEKQRTEKSKKLLYNTEKIIASGLPQIWKTWKILKNCQVLTKSWKSQGNF